MQRFYNYFSAKGWNDIAFVKSGGGIVKKSIYVNLVSKTRKQVTLNLIYAIDSIYGYTVYHGEKIKYDLIKHTANGILKNISNNIAQVITADEAIKDFFEYMIDDLESQVYIDNIVLNMLPEEIYEKIRKLITTFSYL